MEKSLFHSNGRFYKANLHMHTTISDGKLTPEEIKKAYQEYGFDVIAITDHDKMVAHPELTDDSFVVLTAEENSLTETHPVPKVPGVIDDRSIPFCFRFKDLFHVILISPKQTDPYLPWPSQTHCSNWILNVPEGKTPYPPTHEHTRDIVNDVLRDAKEHGFLTILCHPYWSKNRYPDYSALENVDFVEVHNSVSRYEGYLSDCGDRVFDDMLSLGKHVAPVADDDSHDRPEIGRGATYIKADALTYDAIIEGLRKKDVFATEGPVFRDIRFDSETNRLTVDCSDAKQIAVETSVRFAKSCGEPYGDADVIRHAEFDLSVFMEGAKKYGDPKYDFIRVNIVDAKNRKAYSRGYYIDELLAD